MNFYFVKLSCPSKNDDNNHFGNIVQSCFEKEIKPFEVDNIPNHIADLKIDDLVIFIFSGDQKTKTVILVIIIIETLKMVFMQFQ